MGGAFNTREKGLLLLVVVVVVVAAVVVVVVMVVVDYYFASSDGKSRHKRKPFFKGQHAFIVSHDYSVVSTDVVITANG